MFVSLGSEERGNDGMNGTKTQKMSEQSNWIHEFENLYILTYKSLYRHAKLVFGQEEKARELLVQV